MLNNIVIDKLTFPNLGLGYYTVLIFFLLVLLYKGRGKSKEKFEGILFTTLLVIFLFLLICIAITDIHLLRDAMLYKIGLPSFLMPVFKYIEIYRNLIICIVLIIFLISISIYLYKDFVIDKTFINLKKPKLFFYGALILATCLEIYDYGAHYVKDIIKDEIKEEFSEKFYDVMSHTDNYKYLVLVNNEYMPPYTSGTSKNLFDLATFYNLKTNIGLYARNSKKDLFLYKDNEIIDFKYDIRDDAIYVFVGPCFNECTRYDLTYYLVNNYLFGVSKPIPKITYEVKNKNTNEMEKKTVEIKPIEDLDFFLENYSRHVYENVEVIEALDEKAHAISIVKCKYCNARDSIYYRQTTNGHLFNDYVDNDDANVNVHGTRTSRCICGAKVDEPVKNDILGHKYEMVTFQTPTNEEPGIRALRCAICEKILEETAKYTYINLEYDKVLYDGEVHTPKLSIIDGDGNVYDESLYKLTYSDNKEVGSAMINVRFNDKNDPNNIPFNVYYYILPLEPEIISANRTNKGLNVKLVKPECKYDGYQVEYSDNRSFDEEHTGMYDYANKNKSEINVRDADENKHYVRVRVYRKTKGETNMVYSDWSNVVRFD